MRRSDKYHWNALRQRRAIMKTIKFLIDAVVDFFRVINLSMKAAQIYRSKKSLEKTKDFLLHS